MYLIFNLLLNIKPQKDSEATRTERRPKKMLSELGAEIASCPKESKNKIVFVWNARRGSFHRVQSDQSQQNSEISPGDVTPVFIALTKEPNYKEPWLMKNKSFLDTFCPILVVVIGIAFFIFMLYLAIRLNSNTLSWIVFILLCLFLGVMMVFGQCYSLTEVICNQAYQKRGRAFRSIVRRFSSERLFWSTSKLRGWISVEILSVGEALPIEGGSLHYNVAPLQVKNKLGRAANHCKIQPMSSQRFSILPKANPAQ